MLIKEKILIIDDEIPTLEITSLLLNNQGYQTLTSIDGENFLEIINSELPDLVLTDANMPKISGMEICKKIKQIHPEIFVIIYTGVLTSSDQQAIGLESGADGYILKDTPKRELIARIEVLLRLQKAEKKLRETNSTKDTMCSILSHDLRGLFLPIIGYTDLIYKRLDTISKNDLKRYITIIHNYSLNIEGLLENMLYWSKNQILLAEPVYTSFNLYDEVQSLIDVNNIKAKNKNITVSNLIDSKTIIFSDKNIISLAVRNLISNALKFTNPNGQIQIDFKDLGDHIEISVSDNGIGIPEDVKLKLFHFDKSNICEGTENERGTGLGLMIIYEYIKKINGSVIVESEVGHGSKFTILLEKKQ